MRAFCSTKWTGDAKERVTRTFDLIRLEDGFPRIYDAFVRAVVIEVCGEGNFSHFHKGVRHEQDHGHRYDAAKA
jgi:hypothetical protein